MEQRTYRATPVTAEPTVSVAPTPAQVVVERPTSVWTVAFVSRLVLTLGGAAVTIVAAFLPWVGSIGAVNLDDHAFFREPFRSQGGFVRTVGAVVILIALAAIVGLALPGGWLIRFAAVLGIVGPTLVLIQAYRAAAHPAVGPGAWISLVGAMIVLVGGFFVPGTVDRVPAAPPRFVA